MRTVRMRYHVTGGRADGTDWPNMGETLIAEDGEAAELVAAGLADWADSDAPVTPPPAEPQAAAIDPALVTPPDAPPDDPAAFAAQDDTAPAAGTPPPVRAPRADWAAHAITLGVAPADVDEMTKAQLIARYGNNSG